jgi:hypothetical protein
MLLPLLEALSKLDLQPEQCVTEADDIELIRLVREQPGNVKRPDWEKIAAQLGPGWTSERAYERWVNFVQPPLNRTEMTVAEKRRIVGLYLKRPGDWRWIASQLAPDRSRSAAMVKQAFMFLRPRLTAFGFDGNSLHELDRIPDSVFETGPIIYAPPGSRARAEAAVLVPADRKQ